jgi:ketosteroid isomerase-like protein
MRIRSVILATALMCGCSLRHRPAPPEPARGPALDSLFQIDQSRGDSLLALGQVAGMLALLGKDVVYLRAGVPAVYGREGARTLFAAGSGAEAYNLAWQPVGGGVADDLKSGYTYGVVARLPQPKAAVRFERYVAYWRRAGAEPWRISAYSEVGSLPASDVTLAADQLTPPLRKLPEPLETATAQVRAADSSFSDLAYRMGTGFAFSNTAADNGVVFGTPQLIVGPEAIRSYYAAQGTSTSLTWRPVYAVVAGSRDLGFTIGEYIATGRGSSGAAVQRFGKYLTVWKLQRDGTWKFVVDGGSPSPARESQSSR